MNFLFSGRGTRGWANKVGCDGIRMWRIKHRVCFPDSSPPMQTTQALQCKHYTSVIPYLPFTPFYVTLAQNINSEGHRKRYSRNL
eukprot:1342932-Amorphochlora_amoeboformis.AAC.2